VRGGGGERDDACKIARVSVWCVPVG
jgi:hypothetical protein